MRIILTNAKVYNDDKTTKIFIEDRKFAKEFSEDKAYFPLFNSIMLLHIEPI